MKTLDFYFDFSCPYAYLAATQIEALAARTGAQLNLKPMVLGGVFKARAVPQNLAATLSPEKARHNVRDMQRWASYFGVPLAMPKGHPMRTVDALRALLATGEPTRDLMHRFYRAYWVEGRDIASEAVVGDVLRAAGHDAAAVMERARSQEIKDALRVRTDEAIALGIFGAPTCVVDGELFWGQDRLEEVERACGGLPDRPAPAISYAGTLHPVDFYFDYSSPFSCLGAARVERLFGRAATWRPMLLGAVFKAVKMANVPLFGLSGAKRKYLTVDLKRQAAQAEFSFQWPRRFPMNTVLPLRVTHAAGVATTDQGRALIQRIYRAYWSEDQNISDPEVITALCDEVGLDGAALVARASDPEMKQALRDSTGRAVEAGIFGAPTTVVHHPDGPELFWGNDRLEAALRCARDSAPV